jgi:hypothetical protein
MSVLLTLAICSTRTSATSLISGTAATSSSPSSSPDLYSARLVDEAPLPEIVPPVESTMTSGFGAGACAAGAAT